METRDLDYVLAVEREGGIGRAADALGIAQPSLTKATAPPIAPTPCRACVRAWVFI